jgi:hypothetical protein
MFFLNPIAMVVGGALISAPILIHLINRMRFKRIRWAAMEFLLKSQKRNRRRLIIEQIILLMLRCLLVILAAFVVARYVGEALGGTSKSGTTHVLVLDRSLSMADRAPKNQNPGPNCFAAAKQQIEGLARYAAQAPTAQHLVIMDMGSREVIFDKPLKEEHMAELRSLLNGLEPTNLVGNAPLALEEAKKKVSESKDAKKWLHVVSDFREHDWGRRPGTEQLHKTLEEIAETGANVSLIDTAAPSREASRGKVIEHHNNFAITDLRPEKRVAPAGTVVPFTMEVENFGNESLPALFIEVFLNGDEDKFATKIYEPAPSPGSKQRYRFEMVLDGPAEGQRSRYYRVTARIKGADPESGLLIDNARHAVVEIRREVPTLVIDGSGDEGLRSGGDTRVIKDALESVKGTEAVKVEVKNIDELLRPDLEREYATIYLLNMATLEGRDDKTKDLPVERLKEFVKKGGNIVYFTGNKVNVTHYNDTLYTKAQGLFPIPIEELESKKLSPDDIKKRRNSSAPKLFVLEKDHDITRGIYDVQYKIPDLIIPQHTPAKERFEWTNEWTQEGDIKELITLAELKELGDTFRTQTQRFLKRLPLDDQNFAKYHTLLNKHKKLIEQALLEVKSDESYKVAEAIDNMLNERGNPTEKDNVSLLDFWALNEMKDLKTDLLSFRKAVLYGKPLVVTRKYGKGSVVAFMTSAGTEWSGWSGGLEGGVASFTFPMVIADLQRYLTRGGDGGNRLVGQELSFTVDPAQFKPEVKIYTQHDEGAADKGRAQEGDAPVGYVAPSQKTPSNNDNKVAHTFTAPGAHFVKLTPQGGREAEEHWFAVNIDTESESNLRRVTTDELVRNPTDAPPTRGKIGIGSMESLQDKLREKKSDASENAWLYIIFMLVLIAEQALAVHLSFHVKGGESATPGPAMPASAK